MVVGLFLSFLGVNELPKQAQNLILRVVLSVMLLDLIWNLSTAFYVLFVIDLVGIKQLGILIAVGFLLQAVLDYPSGALGDWIGQRWILFFGFSLQALAFTALLFANSFSSLLVVYVLEAIAVSQQSGAIATWLDNNYKVVADDPQRDKYKFFMGRWRVFMFIAPGVSIAFGGVLATVYERKLVFFIQVIGLATLAILFLMIVKDFPSVERPKRSLRNYFHLLGEGIQFVLLNKMMFLFVVGLCISETVSLVWIQMMLYPVYFGYTGSDSGVGFLRFIVLMLGTILAFYAAKIATKLSIKWIPWLILSNTALFFWGMALLTAYFPVDKNAFTPLAILFLLTVYASSLLFHNLRMVLRQRLFLDLIPDRNRNSIYSLIPTLLLITGAPVMIIGGYLIENLGISLTAWILGTVGVFSFIFYYLSIRTIPKEQLDSF
ncbi:MAG: MFS transporter [Promethearchaeota archaeon]